MAYLSKKGNQYLLDNFSLSNVQMLELDIGEVLEVDIKVVDKRNISENQRKLIFAICGDIENYTGYDKELIRATAMQTRNVISLKQCSMTQANEVIDELIDFCLINQIPFSMNTRNDSEFKFSEKHMYMLTLTRTCCITGQQADIHHVDRVGIGQNRDKISHLGKRILPLSRKMHNEIHSIGDEAFMEKYHVEPIVVDERIEYFVKKGKVKIYDEDLKDD